MTLQWKNLFYLFEEGKSSTYLADLSYYLKFKGKPDITNNFIISKLVNGAKRLAAGPDIRRPITVTILGHLLQALAHVIKAYYQRIMFEAVSISILCILENWGNNFTFKNPSKFAAVSGCHIA